jgi:high-affinity nickel-transport protein
VTGLLAICALGFFLGMRHATDADHVIAVSTIVARHRTVKGAATIGAAWGVGHTLTILAVGGGIILLGWVIPERVGLSMEFAVAVMLVVLGIMNLGGLADTFRGSVVRAESAAGHGHPPATPAAGHVHAHAHSHGDYVHTHVHGHDPEAHPHCADETPLARLDRRLGRLGVYQLARPLVVGIVHGLAGSAAVALLVLAAIQSPTWSLLYLLVFGFGTVLGMMVMTAIISVPFTYSGVRAERLHRGLRLASGAVSLAFGLFLAYRVGIVDGLFTGNPQWDPH